MWDCVFSVYPLPLWWLREYTLCLIIIIKSEVWSIIHCLGLGHETMVCAVWFSVFLLRYMHILMHKDNYKHWKICIPLCQTYKPSSVENKFPKSLPTHRTQVVDTDIPVTDLGEACVKICMHWYIYLYLNQCFSLYFQLYINNKPTSRTSYVIHILEECSN